MPPFDIILRLSLFACPLIVAALALFRFRRSRSVNRPIYGLVFVAAIALIIYSARDLLFAPQVPLGAVAAAISAAPIWIATIVVCAFTRRSRYYVRRSDGYSPSVYSDDIDHSVVGARPPTYDYTRFPTHGSDLDTGPQKAERTAFKTRRLNSHAGGATSTG